MGGCFGDNPSDHWLESQVDAYTDPVRRLSLRDRQALEDAGLDEKDVEDDDEKD